MIARLVGQPTKHISRDKMILHMRLLYQLKMGYVDLNHPRAHQSIGYYPEEHLYDHDLSVQSIGRQYEVKKLKELIPLDLYLNLPIDISDALVKGMMIGAEDRIQLEKAAIDEKTRQDELAKSKQGEGFNKLHEK